jgi:transcriptional regulator GlxA family with amidase domain
VDFSPRRGSCYGCIGLYPRLTVCEDARWVEDGHIVTSGGISAGIDMSLHLVRRLFGDELAESTARQMEYDWQTEP